MNTPRLMIVIALQPERNHPVAATWIKNAAKRGTKLIVADPRRTDLARHAWRMLQFRPTPTWPAQRAMMHTIVDEGLTDRASSPATASAIYEALGQRGLRPRRWRRLRHPGRDHPRGGARLRAAKAAR